MVSPDSGAASLIFISHAGSEAAVAADLARELNNAGVRTLLDAQVLNAGDNFVAFMEGALSEADYFLLLWSRAAASKPWVTTEWQAALVRAVQEETAFFITARLEDFPVPALLAPRLWIDLFPQFSPGVERLIATVRGDEQAARVSSKPVAPPRLPIPPTGGATIYITSELFDFTVPVDVDPDVPVGVHLDRIVKALGLPTYHPLDRKGRIAVRVSYVLLHGERRLRPTDTLTKSGVGQGEVLGLESHFQFSGASEPVTAESGGGTYRADVAPEPDPEPILGLDSLVRRSRLLMHSAARRAGLTRDARTQSR